MLLEFSVKELRFVKNVGAYSFAAPAFSSSIISNFVLYCRRAQWLRVSDSRKDSTLVWLGFRV